MGERTVRTSRFVGWVEVRSLGITSLCVPNRVTRGFSPLVPTAPRMRICTGRFLKEI